MSPELEIGLLIEAQGRHGRVVRDCGSFIVVTVGDPDRRHQTKFDVAAFPREQVTVVE